MSESAHDIQHMLVCLDEKMNFSVKQSVADTYIPTRTARWWGVGVSVGQFGCSHTPQYL